MDEYFVDAGVHVAAEDVGGSPPRDGHSLEVLGVLLQVSHDQR